MNRDMEIHDEVMKKVIAFEKRRTYSWAARFFVVTGICIIGLGISLWAFGAEVLRRQSLELLGIFQEDWEIIQEYWQDTAGVFFEELPNEWLLLLLIVLVGLIGVAWITGKQRGRVLRRFRELASYGKIRKNTDI